jgi:hypothetical protein
MEHSEPLAERPVLLAVDDDRSALDRVERELRPHRTRAPSPSGWVELKGKAEPVEAHRLVGFDTPRG